MVQYKTRVVLVGVQDAIVSHKPRTRVVLFQDESWQEAESEEGRDRILMRDDVRATLVALKDGESLEVSVAVVPFRTVE